MGVLDEFTYYGRFTGIFPEPLNEKNFDHELQTHGEEWVAGYLKAMEVVLVNLSDILQPASDNINGFPQTPHMVRRNLREYWKENFGLTKQLLSQLPTTPDDPKP